MRIPVYEQWLILVAKQTCVSLATWIKLLGLKLDHLLFPDTLYSNGSDQFGSSVQLDVSRARASSRSVLDHELVLAARLQRYARCQTMVGTVHNSHRHPRETLPPIPPSWIHQLPTKKLWQGSVFDLDVVRHRAVAATVDVAAAAARIGSVISVRIRLLLAKVLRRVAGLVTKDLLDPSFRAGNSRVHARHDWIGAGWWFGTVCEKCTARRR
jgi:hypothetical protein